MTNAVAPDWNLKVKKAVDVLVDAKNAVAPDWNLKCFDYFVSIL